ncbi:MAG: SPBc2 prophage-derived aminoglycoside N(3)-acetyltransferase-like protein YokD [Actinomycetota bacterium]
MALVSEREIIAATTAPATRTSLTADLRALGVAAGDVLVVHTSMSALGWVVGGAQTVVDALLDAVGPEGTLTMPAHSSDRSEPSRWSNPPVPEEWWPVIRDHVPAFHPALTPMHAMGAAAEVLLRHPGTLRSAHPNVSHMAIGPQARTVTDHHPFDRGMGDESPLGRLYELDAKVLLLGVGHANNTSLHLAEHRADWPSKRFVRQGSAVLVDGQRCWVEYDELDGDTDDFEALGAAFAATGLETVGPVGNAGGQARLMPMRALVDFATMWFPTHRA